MSCRLTGKKRNKITCTVRRPQATRGVVRVRVTRGGKLVASRTKKATGKATVMTLRGIAQAGRRYTLTTIAARRSRTGRRSRRRSSCAEPIPSSRCPGRCRAAAIARYGSGFSNQWSWNGPGLVVAGGISTKPQDA